MNFNGGEIWRDKRTRELLLVSVDFGNGRYVFVDILTGEQRWGIQDADHPRCDAQLLELFQFEAKNIEKFLGARL